MDLFRRLQNFHDAVAVIAETNEQWNEIRADEVGTASS
jgi:hypothetical protein